MVHLDKIAIKVSRMSYNVNNKNTQKVYAMAYLIENTKQKNYDLT